MLIPWLLYLALALILIVCLYAGLIGLPGLWLMALAAVIYAVCTHFVYVGLRTIIAALLLALVAEVTDFALGASRAKRAGANRRGLIGAIIGGMAGAIFLSTLVPIIGTIVGLCIGTFAGAVVGELWGGTQFDQSLRVGWGAMIGRLLGLLAKLLFGCVLLGIVLIAAVPPLHRPIPPAPISPTPTLPARPETRPTTSADAQRDTWITSKKAVAS